VEEAHRDPAAEQHDRRHDEQWREQAHRHLGRAVRDVVTATRVVTDETPSGAEQLQDDRWDQGEPDEDVPRHERVHTEKDGRDLENHRSEQEHSNRRGETLVSVGVHGALLQRNCDRAR
jgi:hypothetical protein